MRLGRWLLTFVGLGLGCQRCVRDAALEYHQLVVIRIGG